MTTPKNPAAERGDAYRKAVQAIERLKNTCTNRKAQAELKAAYSAIIMAHTYEYNAGKAIA